MAATTTTLPLNDGVDMPSVGVLSFRRDSLKELKDALTNCIERGVRHFEISDLYGNVNIVVSHLLTHEIPREQLFFTLKVFLYCQCQLNNALVLMLVLYCSVVITVYKLYILDMA